MFAAQVARFSVREKHQPCNVKHQPRSVKDLPCKPEGYPRE
jgi:hypothetical protein